MNPDVERFLDEAWRQASRNDRGNLSHFIQELIVADNHLDRIHMDGLATWYWLTHDPAYLQAEFDKRIDAQGFPHFHFDPSDTDEEDEPWAAAWELAIIELEAGGFSYRIEWENDEVQIWWEARRASLPRQLALF